MKRITSVSVLGLLVLAAIVLRASPPEASAQGIQPQLKPKPAAGSAPTPAAGVAPKLGAEVKPQVAAEVKPNLVQGVRPELKLALPTKWAFETALGSDWQVTGATPGAVRVCGTTSRKNRPVPRDTLKELGGNYWDTPVPVGRGCVLDTASATGKVQVRSPLFTAGKQVSLLLGGGAGAKNRATRVELQDEAGKVLASANAPGVGRWTRVVWKLDRSPVVAAGTKLRIIAIDDSTGTGATGILLDDVMHGDVVEAGPPSTPLWGFADLHTHFFNQMGNGGRLFAGKIHSCVGQSRVECTTASNPAAALSDCAHSHGNNGGDGVLSLVPEQGHARAGFPTFKGWPRMGSLGHQQMYVDWLKRSWRGGLRVVHMDVLNNHSMAWIYDFTGGIRVNGNELIPGNRLPNSVDDDANIEMQVRAAKDFMRLPDVRDWAEIAYSAADARRIVSDGKLAVVLGIELDDFGGFNRHPTKNLWAVSDRAEAAARARRTDAAAEAEIRTKVATYLDWLHGLGVRHAFPVHVFDSPFGGTAVSELLPDLGQYVFTRYYTGNGRWGDATRGRFTQVRNTSAADGIFLRLDHEYAELKKAADDATPLLDLAKALGILPQVIDEVKGRFLPILTQRYTETRGIRFGGANARGLTRAGVILVEEMMKRGMIVDVSHSSDAATNAVIEVARRRAVPIMAGHTGFRDTSYGTWRGPLSPLGYFETQQRNTEAFDFSDAAAGRRKALGIDNPGHQAANERGLSLSQIRAIRDLGGMVGIGTGPGSTPYRADPGRPAPDCDGTTKALLQSYLYLSREMGGRGVALGTDYNGFVSGVIGRFGGHACSSSAGDKIRWQFANPQARAQRTPVRYAGENNGIRWMDRSRFEGAGTLSNLDAPNFSMVDSLFQMLHAEVFKETMREWRPQRTAVIEDEMAIWEGLYRAKINDPAVTGGKPFGCDAGNRGYQRDMLRYGWGFSRAFRGLPRPGSDCILDSDTNADSNAAWDAVRNTPSSGWQNAAVTERVKRILEKWNLLAGPNPPLEKLTMSGGGVTRDFDFNVDGLANYGLLPDMLQDLRNILADGGHDRRAAEEMAPLFSGAEDFVVMWEQIERGVERAP